MTRETHISVVVLQTVAADYNKVVFEELSRQLGGDFRVLAGDEYFDMTVRRIDESCELIESVTNHFLLRRNLLWQSGRWRVLLSADAAVVEFNPRIMSTWALLLARRILAKRTVLWGHAWPRAGRGSRTVWLRRAMCRLADSVVVYTEQQARELRQLVRDVPVSAAPNALYRAGSMRAATRESPTNIIYVGRLVPAKKPLLLLEGYAVAKPRLPPQCALVFVGDGPERPELERRIRAHGLDDRVHLLGHITDVDTLRELYSDALVSVSPGYVGLSITQSFAFGVPMLFGRNEPHAPEIEAAVQGINAVTFDENDAGSLASSLLKMFRDRHTWIAARESIARNCAERYSVEVMARRLVEAACDGRSAH
jgi:glycosyltransferase involved in cell wall biosynthesis